MKYITHKRFKNKGLLNKDYNLPYATEVQTMGKYIIYNNEPICLTTSYLAHQYFSRNDDNNGLERGNLTYAIAFSNRKPNKNNGFRFTEQERELLRTEYSHFLKNEDDWILFNHHFFNADIDELRELAKKLNIKV